MVDTIIKDVEFSVIRLIAALFILIGFATMLLPEEWNYPIQNTLGCSKCTPSEAELREGETRAHEENDNLNEN